MLENNFFLADSDAQKDFLKLFASHVPLGPLCRWRMVMIHKQLQEKILHKKFPIIYLWEYLETLSHWENVEKKHRFTLSPSKGFVTNGKRSFDWTLNAVPKDRDLSEYSPTKPKLAKVATRQSAPSAEKTQSTSSSALRSLRRR
jgi:hypothetical protein